MSEPTSADPVSGTTASGCSLPAGTRIRFLRTLQEGPSGDHPAFLFAVAGELGTVVSDFPCAEGHCVKWDGWPHAAFGAVRGVDFEEANATRPAGNAAPDCSQGIGDPIDTAALLPCPFCGRGKWEQSNYAPSIARLYHAPDCYLRGQLGESMKTTLSTLSPRQIAQWQNRPANNPGQLPAGQGDFHVSK